MVFVISSTREVTNDDETTYGVKDLLTNVNFTVNGEDMDDVVDLSNSGSGVEWHELVMAGFALPAGNVEITIKSNSGKNALMPQVRNISLFSSEVITLAVEE